MYINHLLEFLVDNEGAGYYDIIEQVERPLIEMVLIKNRGNVFKSSKELGIQRNTLTKKMQKYGMIKRGYKK